MQLLTFLLQITTPSGPTTADPNAAAGLQNEAAQQSLSLIDLIVKGGPIMIPIFLLSFVAVYIFIERYMYIRKAGQLDNSLLPMVKDKLVSGSVRQAQELARNAGYPIARMIEKGISRIGQPLRDVEAAMESSASLEASRMEKNLNILAAIAAVAPMFGFLGTVAGMIKAFYDISLADNISIGVISSGIYTKMVTSASGLIVGVLGYVFYTTLNTMIERVTFKMEVTAVEFLDLLHNPVEK
jgi:biopolymer transport protein ExbB